MKLNPKLLERLSQSHINTEEFVRRVEETKMRKIEPEQFLSLNQSQSSIRIRTLQVTKEETTLKEKQSIIAASLSQSFYYTKNKELQEKDQLLQQSQLTRATTAQNQSQLTQSSGSIFTGKQRVLTQKQFIAGNNIKGQQSMFLKKGSLGNGIMNISTVSQSENDQMEKPGSEMIPQKPQVGLIKGLKPPLQKILFKKSQLFQIGDKSVQSSLNNSLLLENKSQLTQQGIVNSQGPNQLQPQQNVPIGIKLRGASQQRQKPISKLVTTDRKGTEEGVKKLNSSEMSIRQKLSQKDLPFEESEPEGIVYEAMNEDILRSITKKKPLELCEITKLMFRFKSQNDSLQLLGELMPSLRELRLSNSFIHTLRDLGTSLTNVRILWISRSLVKDLSGINGLPYLCELYCCFNNVSDLSPLSFHQNLQILDLEGNDIADECQIDALESLDRLEELNISQNPIVKNDKLREILRQRLSRIYVTDGQESMDSEVFEDSDCNQRVNRLYEIARQVVCDVDELRDLEMRLQDELYNEQINEPDELLLIAEQLKTKNTQKDNKQRPQTAIVKGTQKPKDQQFKDFNIMQDDKNLDDPTSELLHDAAICGNPLKAARQKKKNKEQQDFDPLDRQSMDIRKILKKFQQ